MDPERLDHLIREALSEDIGPGDHTTLACIPAGSMGKAVLLVKQEGVLAGVQVAGAVFRRFDPELRMDIQIPDGSPVRPGDRPFILSGRQSSILQTERLILNILQRMSGIATRTAAHVAAVAGTGARILDTRKTTPNFRLLEKEAVRIGGGLNHRFGLFDMIMIKDNHVDFAGGITRAIDMTLRYLEKNRLSLDIEVEARNMEEVSEILKYPRVRRILLDNFTPGQIREAVDYIAGRAETEASGGISLENVRDFALAGADYISIGALTHQVSSLDISLKAYK